MWSSSCEELGEFLVLQPYLLTRQKSSEFLLKIVGIFVPFFLLHERFERFYDLWQAMGWAIGLQLQFLLKKEGLRERCRGSSSREPCRAKIEKQCVFAVARVIDLSIDAYIIGNIVQRSENINPSNSQLTLLQYFCMKNIRHDMSTRLCTY